MFSGLGSLSDCAVPCCRYSNPHALQTKKSICAISFLFSLVMVFIAAMSPTKPLPKGDHDIPVASHSIGVEITSPSVQPNGNPMKENMLPKARSRRRSSQNKTSYQLAHPPPTVKHRQRLRIRPKTLLQLQQLSSTSRPLPIMDVVPSILFAPRLAQRIPQIFHGNRGLGLDDLVFIRSQSREPVIEMQARPPEDINGLSGSSPEVVAATCQSSLTVGSSQCRTEIRFSGNSLWTATALSSGAYEFVSYVHGQPRSIARWVPKRDTEGGISNQRFKFSLIDTSVRRHPVIANISKQCIEIYDWYTTPSEPCDSDQISDTVSRALAIQGGSPDIRFGDCNKFESRVIEVDDELRSVIAVTGIWVAFCEGWSPNFKYGTRQVISTGISELSSRRRSENTPPTSPIVEKPYPQYQPQRTRSAQVRPVIPHTSSLSSVPSMSSLGSPTMSPRRTVSSYARGSVGQHTRRNTSFDIVRRPSPIISEPNSSGNFDEVRSWPSSTKVETCPKRDTAVNHSGQGARQMDEVPMAESHQRKASGQDLASEITLVEEIVKRPGRFRRALGYLRRSKTSC